jgi:predicted ATPase
VGFGYTYILPIVVSGLIAKSGEILIVENPEAHLHPKAQSELTKFLALVASCGVQVFIESHSEHVLNAIRVVTLQKEIDIKNDEVSVLYFQNDKKEPFVHLKIDEKGKINNWVDGFFDQQELDLGEIFKLSRKK